MIANLRKVRNRHKTQFHDRHLLLALLPALMADCVLRFRSNGTAPQCVEYLI